jgi:L,D-transpeptidase YcbB
MQPTFLALSALAVAAAAPVLAQALPAAPAPEPASAVQEAPAAPVAPQWSRANAEDLLRYVERVGQEGLDPAAYEPSALRMAIAAGEGADLNTVATRTFLRLSSDLALGYARGPVRVGWHMNDPDLSGNQQYAMLAEALQRRGLAAALDALLPTHPQYGFLKTALAATPAADKARIDLIRTNMDRWRWLPRDLGDRYVLVNVPAFTAAIVENGEVVARHRTVVGALKTPTPQLMATARAVTFNPSWFVPASIQKELGANPRGYEKTAAGGLRQPPGPANALGRMKIEMPNNHAIYLHDTPAKALFDRDVRAFSHGCIRTQNALQFAQWLLEPTGQWDKAAIDRAVASGKTVEAKLSQPTPVYIAYFTAAAAADGKIVAYKDIYGRDGKVVTALRTAGSSLTETAAR